MTTQLDARLSRYSSPLLSVFRIVFGLLFAIHGSQKLFGWPVPAPAPIEVGDWPMWWAGLIELVCGLLIAVGLFTRIAAIIAAGEMAVAYFWQHWPPLEGPRGSFWPIANNGEPAVLYCFGFLALAALGAGAWSVDARRRGAAGGYAGAPPRRVGAVTAREEQYVATDAPPRRRGGLLSRFRRPRY
ncbi:MULTISPECIES: DoxX family protein [unclassified Mycobacterium]|uniref:DoxX family protein n=1 Tax=unclassified Mycobacterium TaxID=2642494 RepID=UPI0007402143|nr:MULTISPECIES: DoxX family protein [unclassified Mycobacterium]KUH83901.1 DoxX family protein [Mycobacterium sp. IS-1556]KUH88486.1 DoxX family protein [Mycobacterium sp. GA-0227b]KUH89691.1 DoxX family protein [Mycobacterium sp. GA-1999]